MAPNPWFSEWNYRVLQVLFQLLPHHAASDQMANFLVNNHLVTSWIFAAAFYLFWTIEDSRTAWRRSRLFQLVVAFAIAVVISLAIRPWIAWPPPGLNPRFRVLYPSYYWVIHNPDSFPSHATLVAFTVAVGLWPLSRRVSLLLSLAVLMLISLPRIYVAGHYPIDVLASLLLVLVVVPLMWFWRVPASVVSWLARTGPGTGMRQFLLFYWVFELGENFRGTSYLLRMIAQFAFHWRF